MLNIARVEEFNEQGKTINEIGGKKTVKEVISDLQRKKDEVEPKVPELDHISEKFIKNKDIDKPEENKKKPKLILVKKEKSEKKDPVPDVKPIVENKKIEKDSVADEKLEEIRQEMEQARQELEDMELKKNKMWGELENYFGKIKSRGVDSDVEYYEHLYDEKRKKYENETGRKIDEKDQEYPEELKPQKNVKTPEAQEESAKPEPKKELPEKVEIPEAIINFTIEKGGNTLEKSLTDYFEAHPEIKEQHGDIDVHHLIVDYFHEHTKEFPEKEIPANSHVVINLHEMRVEIKQPKEENKNKKEKISPEQKKIFDSIFNKETLFEKASGLRRYLTDDNIENWRKITDLSADDLRKNYPDLWGRFESLVKYKGESANFKDKETPRRWSVRIAAI